MATTSVGPQGDIAMALPFWLPSVKGCLGFSLGTLGTYPVTGTYLVSSDCGRRERNHDPRFPADLAVNTVVDQEFASGARSAT